VGSEEKCYRGEPGNSEKVIEKRKKKRGERDNVVPEAKSPETQGTIAKTF